MKLVTPSRRAQTLPGPGRASGKQNLDWAYWTPAIYAAIHAAVFAYLNLPEQNPTLYCNRLEFLFSAFTPCDPDNFALGFQVWMIITLGFALTSTAKKVRIKPIFGSKVGATPIRTVRRGYYILSIGLWLLICAFVAAAGREVPIPYVSALMYLLGAILFPTLLFCTNGARPNPVLGLLLAGAATAAFLTKIPLMIFILAYLSKVFSIRRIFTILAISFLLVYALAYFSVYRSFITNSGNGSVLTVLSSHEVEPLFILGRLLARIALIDASVFIADLVNSGYLVFGTLPEQAIQLVNGYFDIARGEDVVFGYAIGLPMAMYVWLGPFGLLLIAVMVRVVDVAVVSVFQKISDTQNLFTLRLTYFLVFMQDSFGVTFQLLIAQLIGFALARRIISRRQENTGARLIQVTQATGRSHVKAVAPDFRSSLM